MRLGLHINTKSGNGFFGEPSVERDLQIDTMRRMGVTDCKLLCSGDSQLKASKWLTEQGFAVMVRFYALPGELPVPATDLMQLYADVGVRVAESVNEPELEQGPPSVELIDQLAQQHIRFADQCYRVGIKPVTPSIQGDRVFNYFEPLLDRIIGLGRKDALEGSYIGCHPRPANNLPMTSPPGFVVRSYELFDEAVRKRLGHSLPIYATEWGYEPGDNQNSELPRISREMHSALNVRLAQTEWRPCLEVAYYWTWLNDWFESGWWRGDVASSLPVVKAFIDMPKTAASLSDADMRRIAEAHGQEIRIFPDGALYKLAQAQGLGYPVCNEWQSGGRIWQTFERPDIKWKSIVSCRQQSYDDLRFVTW